MEEKILALFYKRPDDYISGEFFSDRLGISRAAVWKHIESLREEGYVIEAQPHLGYRLSNRPDRLLPFEIGFRLKTKIIGKKIFSFNVVDSTMDVASDLAQRLPHDGISIFSEGQRRGRGRMGRGWFSPKRKGIYLSVILRPNITPAECPKITLLSAVAVVNTVRDVTGLEALIKWPNDCLIDNEKVCGILTEINAEQDKINFLIIGIGININNGISELPKGATSLREKLGNKVDRLKVARALLKQMDRQYLIFTKAGFEPIASQWKNNSATLGRRIAIQYKDHRIEGQAMDVDAEGALIVRLDNGFNERVLAGDVVIVR